MTNVPPCLLAMSKVGQVNESPGFHLLVPEWSFGGHRRWPGPADTATGNFFPVATASGLPHLKDLESFYKVCPRIETFPVLKRLDQRRVLHRMLIARSAEPDAPWKVLATAIGKSQPHVKYMAAVHKIKVDNPGYQGSFNDAYQKAKRGNRPEVDSSIMNTVWFDYYGNPGEGEGGDHDRHRPAVDSGDSPENRGPSPDGRKRP